MDAMESMGERNDFGKKVRGLRTCVACRRKAPAAELVRFVCGPDGPSCAVGKTPRSGRGCSLCPAAGCFERAASGRKSPLRECGARDAAGLLRIAMAAYQGRLEILRRSRGLSQAERMETMLARLQDALETLSCRSGDTHVR